MANQNDNQERGRSFLARYGATILRGGIASIPTALYRYQAVLKLSPQQVWFISAVLAHKWDADLPYPSLRKMAGQTGISRQQLHTYQRSLVDAKLLTILNRTTRTGGKDTNFYDFTALFTRLEELIQEEQDATGEGGGGLHAHDNPGLHAPDNGRLHPHVNPSAPHKEPVSEELESSNLRRAAQAVDNLGPAQNALKAASQDREDEQHKLAASPKDRPPSSERGEPSPSSSGEHGGLANESSNRQAYGQQKRGLEQLRDVLNRHTLTREDQDTREAIQSYIADIAREFGDKAKLKSSVTRAYNLYEQSDRTLHAFVDALFLVRANVKERQDSTTQEPIQNRMSYFFSVLADQLGVQVSPVTSSAHTMPAAEQSG